MKKHFSILALLLLVSFNLYAQEQPYRDNNTQEIKKPAVEERLINIDLRRAVQRIQELEREVKDLVSANRSQDDRIRVLEHDMESIRSSQNLRSK